MKGSTTKGEYFATLGSLTESGRNSLTVIVCRRTLVDILMADCVHSAATLRTWTVTWLGKLVSVSTDRASRSKSSCHVDAYGHWDSIDVRLSESTVHKIMLN